MLKDLKIFINTIKNYQTNILTRMNENNESEYFYE